MRTITLTYDPRSNGLTADSDGAGTVVDDCATTLKLNPIPSLPDGCVLDLVADVVVGNCGRRYHPPMRLDSDLSVRIHNQVLQACTGGTLPIWLRILMPNRVVVNSSKLILRVTVLPDAFAELAGAYGNQVMLRTDSWDWVPEWSYDETSFVYYQGDLWRSVQADNLGHAPAKDSLWWEPVGADGVSPTVEWDGDVLVVTDADGTKRGPHLTGPQGPQGLPAESTTPGEFVRRYIGDGMSTEFDVVHNLNTDSPFWQTQLLGERAEYVQIYGYAKDANTLHLSFSEPPGQDAVRVIVSSGMGTGAQTETRTYVHEQDQAAAEWRIEHHLGRPASFTVVDTAGTVHLCAEVIESDDVTVEIFGAPFAGRAIER